MASLIVSLCAFCMLLWIAGIEAPMDAIVPFMWLASFCVMLVFIGAFNISTALGGLLALVGFALGMMTGTFPFEALPAFWQDWVYPWAPQRFMSEHPRHPVSGRGRLERREPAAPDRGRGRRGADLHRRSRAGQEGQERDGRRLGGETAWRCTWGAGFGSPLSFCRAIRAQPRPFAARKASKPCVRGEEGWGDGFR